MKIKECMRIIPRNLHLLIRKDMCFTVYKWLDKIRHEVMENFV